MQASVLACFSCAVDAHQGAAAQCRLDPICVDDTPCSMHAPLKGGCPDLCVRVCAFQQPHEGRDGSCCHDGGAAPRAANGQIGNSVRYMPLHAQREASLYECAGSQGRSPKYLKLNTHLCLRVCALQQLDERADGTCCCNGIPVLSSAGQAGYCMSCMLLQTRARLPVIN